MSATVARSFSLIQGQLAQTREPATGVRRREPDIGVRRREPDIVAAAQRMLAKDAGIAKAILDGSVVYEVDDACDANAHEICGGWHFDGRYHACTCPCHAHELPGIVHHDGLDHERDRDFDGDCA